MNNKRKKPANSEVIEKMVKGFHQKWLETKSVKEIATFFKVDPATVYNHLEEIAELNGVTPEDYRTRKSSKSVKSSKTAESPTKKRNKFIRKNNPTEFQTEDSVENQMKFQTENSVEDQAESPKESNEGSLLGIQPEAPTEKQSETATKNPIEKLEEVFNQVISEVQVIYDIISENLKTNTEQLEKFKEE
ncbi:MAG: hypothetical protein IKD76_03725 [Clostridia bacterium]|nr:hypothetical protein [Clostridia bacterium]